MSYFSKFYQIEVRDEIAKEFTNSLAEVDDEGSETFPFRAF